MPPRLIVVMGPSGCGKSSVAKALSKAIGAPMLEGDDCHSESNRAKMASGSALTDLDRADWLDAIWHALDASLAQQIVLACSALTPYVQSRLREASNREVTFILLDAPRETLAERLEGRAGHFMPATLLASQLEALDPPPDAMVVDARQPIGAMTSEIVSRLKHQTEQQDGNKTDQPDERRGDRPGL
ncbi:MAG: gluconokinase [Erythrobacter sp.]|nr:gluconokinase [Erythrobacter sp.]